MLALLLALLNISGDTFALGVTAIGAAAIAALTAQWRLRAQLGHERELQDREALRLSVERAALTLRQAWDMLGDHLIAMRNAAEAEGGRAGAQTAVDKKAASQIVDEKRAAWEEVNMKLRTHLVATDIDAVSLSIRLASDDPILASFRRNVDMLREIHLVVSRTVPTLPDHALLHQRYRDASVEFEAFLSACLERFGPPSGDHH